MHATAGAECPMHRLDGTQAARPATPDDCVMRGFRNGPATSLSILLPLPGVLARTPMLVVDTMSVAVEPLSIEPSETLVPHDTPPPRVRL